MPELQAGSSMCSLYMEHDKEALTDLQVKMKEYPERSQNQHLMYHKMGIKIHI